MAGTHAAGAGRRRAHERAVDLTREVLLTLAALAGSVCVLAVVLVATMDLGVIVFRTGSMSPTIPTGGAAVVQTVPADRVEVGDVVTVPSPVGPLPVTHRVVHVEQLPDGTTRLRLRGDANDAEDPFPYDVTEVRRVLASAPAVGYVLQRLREPWALVAVTASLSLLVTWALWPRERRRRDEVTPEAPPAGTGTVDDPGTRTRTPGGRGALLGLLGVATTAALLLGPVPAARAGTTPPPGGFPEPAATEGPDGTEGTDDGLLELSASLPQGEGWDLSPGSDLAWRVESSVRPPDGTTGAAGTVWVSLAARGPLVERDGVAVAVQLCDVWAPDGLTCPAGVREVPATVADGVARVDRAEVGTVSSADPQAVVVRLRVPADLGDELQGLPMTLGLRFDAFGDVTYLSDVLAADDPGAGASGGSSVLGLTGADLRPTAWGLLAVLTGAGVAGWAGRRRRAGRVTGAEEVTGRAP